MEILKRSAISANKHDHYQKKHWGDFNLNVEESIFVKKMYDKIKCEKLEEAHNEIVKKSGRSWTAAPFHQIMGMKKTDYNSEPDIIVYDQPIVYFGRVTYKIDHFECVWYVLLPGKDRSKDKSTVISWGYHFWDVASLIRHIDFQVSYYKKKVQLNE